MQHYCNNNQVLAIILYIGGPAMHIWVRMWLTRHQEPLNYPHGSSFAEALKPQSKITVYKRARLLSHKGSIGMFTLWISHAFLIHAALSATGVFHGLVYPTGVLRTLNIIVADGGDGVRVIGKIQYHTLSITMISYKTLGVLKLAKLSSLDWQLQWTVCAQQNRLLQPV